MNRFQSSKYDIPSTREEILEAAWGIDMEHPSKAFMHFNELVCSTTGASLHRGMHSLDLVPDHAQTIDYMSELLISQGAPRKVREAVIANRAGRAALAHAARQEYLLSTALLSPPADQNGQPMVSNPTMHRQLGHLLELAEHDGRMSVRLVPSKLINEMLFGLNVNFFYPDTSQSEPTVYAFGETQRTVLSLDADSTADMQTTWGRMEADALPEQESIRLLSNARRTFV